MKENNIDLELFEKLVELNRLEIIKSRVTVAIFIKNIEETVDNKVDSLLQSFYKQAEFYNQEILDYKDICGDIVKKYREQLNELVSEYKKLFINILLELQDAESKYKIVVNKLKNNLDSENLSEEMKNYIQSKYNCEEIIRECEKKLNECSKNVIDKINFIFGDKAIQISSGDVEQKVTFFTRIKNAFAGKKLFNKYCITPINAELDIIEEKLLEIKEDVYNDTVKFVAKIKKLKDKTDIELGLNIKETIKEENQKEYKSSVRFVAKIRKLKGKTGLMFGNI